MERILLKISGASLKDDLDNGIVDSKKISSLVKSITKLTSKYSVSIVVGGGNIWRGNFNKELQINKNYADDIGMIATIINSLLIKNLLIQNGINARVFSNCISQWTDVYNFENVNEWLSKKNNIAIFAGGTGNSFFSTDTAASLRAAQIGAKKIFMGKNGVDGVYNKDPKNNKDAIFYDKLSYKDLIVQKLKIMDLTALTMCEENNIDIVVFNIDDHTNIQKIIDNKKFKHTLISNK